MSAHLFQDSIHVFTLRTRSVLLAQFANYCQLVREEDQMASTREPLDGFPRFRNMLYRTYYALGIRTYFSQRSHGTGAQFAFSFLRFPPELALLALLLCSIKLFSLLIRSMVRPLHSGTATLRIDLQVKVCWASHFWLTFQPQKFGSPTPYSPVQCLVSYI